MAMFEKEEAFQFIKSFLKIDNAEELMINDRRRLLDEIVFNIHSRMPFQNVWLLSFHPNERRKPTFSEVKANFTSGLGGLCFDMNVSFFHLLTAIGFDALMTHGSCSTTIRSPNNHIAVLVKNVEKDGDLFLCDAACGHPTFQAVSLDFEKESPIFVNSYLEYKFVKHEGKILRMQRKGDALAMRGQRSNPVVDFWLDDWRRFYEVDLEGSTDPSEFETYRENVYIDPACSPFHKSLRVVTFPGGKASMVVDEKTLIDSGKGEFVTTALTGGDEEIMATILKMCPVMTKELLCKSLLNWRQIVVAKK